MCHDGNSAPLSVRYLNSQLAALWENATECMQSVKDSSWDVRSEKYERSKYTRALAQYHFFGKKAPKLSGSPSPLDFHFYAIFGKPEIRFICNHDAVLFLTIQKGHANLDYSKVVSGNGGLRADASKNVGLQNVKVAYRLEFERSKLKGRDTRIGNADSRHLIQLMILKFDTAALVDIETKQELSGDTVAALKVYLGKYLEFLRRAGNHVLFDLPDFDDDKFQAKIDYSQHKETLDLDKFCGGIQVKSIDLTDINEQLARRWASAQRLALIGVEDMLSASLAVFSSQWLPNASFDAHFYIQFRAPRVKALCSHEVILYFDVSRVWFFDNEDFTIGKRDMYENWTIAFIVDVIEWKEGSVTELRLDFENGARFSEIHSVGLTAGDKFRILVSFLSTDYFEVLVSYSMHIMFRMDVLATGFGGMFGGSGGGRISDSDSGSASWSDSDSDEEGGSGGGAVVVGGGGALGVRIRGEFAIYASIITKMSLFGFDQITALSEEAMNAVFVTLYKEARVKGSKLYNVVYQYTKTKLFSAAFSGISVHLLSGNKALVSITIDSGAVFTKKETKDDEPWTLIGKAAKGVSNWLWPKETDETVKYDFTDMTLVYEVDLKMVDDLDLVSTAFSKTFHSGELYGTYQSKIDAYRFKHILLDVRNARFVEELSTTTIFGKDVDGVTRLELVQTHIREYLGGLANNGYTVVQSLPYLAKPDFDRESYAFTSIAFQVISKTPVTIKNCSYKRPAAEAPALLIYGMCGGRPMPNSLIQWLTSWVISGGKRKSYGTICLSKQVFLEGRLLRLLEIVNSRTTLVPLFAGVVDGKSYFDLCAWNEDRYRKNKKCLWKQKESGESSLEYVWEHRDEWSHEHEGTDEKSGEYSLACKTKNKLSIPTHYRANELKITLTGESTIRVKGKSDHSRWSKKTSASWEVAIVVHSKPHGLFVSANVVKAPEVQESEVEGVCDVNVVELHGKKLGLVDFKIIESELNKVLGGAWQYSSSSTPQHRYALAGPVFTRAGDLIVQLIDLKKGLAVETVTTGNGVAMNGRAALEMNGSASSYMVQAAKVDLQATGAISTSTSMSSALDSPAPKTPALDPGAPAFNPVPTPLKTATATPGFNPSLKTGSGAKSTPATTPAATPAAEKAPAPAEKAEVQKK